jgi:parvulin-like peptidyl-prolyl isomerase
MLSKRFLFLAAIVLVSGCGDNSPFNFSKNSKPKQGSAVEQPTAAPQSSPTYAPRAVKGPVIAEVNDWSMGLDDFNERLKTLKDSGFTAELKLEDKKAVLGELVRLVVLSQEAQKQGLGNSQDVQAALEDYRRTLLVQKLGEEINKSIDVNQKDIQDFYDNPENKARYFTEQDKLRLRELAVSSEAVANDIYIRILQGEDFATLAQQNSMLASKSKGGDIGEVVLGAPDKFVKYWEVAAALDKGKASFVFKGEDGKFYILKLEDKKIGTVKAFEDVKEDIKSYLKADKQKKKIEAMVEKAKAGSKIVIKEELLR